MNFSTNQVNQFYVYDAVKHNMTAVLTDDNKSFYFTYNDGNKVALRTDVIEIDKILRMKATAASHQQIKPKKHTISLDAEVAGGNPVVGQEYCMAIRIAPYQGFGDEDYTTITACVRAVDGETPTTLMKKFETAFNGGDVKIKGQTVHVSGSLNEFQKELLDIKASGTNLEIKPLPQTAQWVRGISPVELTHIEISSSPIIVDNIEYDWMVDALSESDKILKNGYTIADMEYFFHGERGDLYRESGYPNVIRYNYLVNPTDETEYDVLDIHFYSDDSKEGVQKSEKDLTIVGLAGALQALITAANQVFTDAQISFRLPAVA